MSDESTESPQRENRLESILLAYVEAAEAGNAPDRQSLIAAHPEFVNDINEFLANYQQLNRMAAPIRVASSGVRAASGQRITQPATVAPDAPGELGQLGDYRLLREIGRGGMGVVYEAEQISLRRRVALKILPFAGGADARQLQRFRNEAEAAAHLHHSHIVPVFAVGAERGVHFYAMQYIEGQSLATLIGDLGAADAKVASDIAQSTQAMAISTEHSSRSNRFFQRIATVGQHIAEALEYAHQMGVIHRDIKPANLLMDARGEVWITDFGLAQFQNQAALTITGELVGTLRYVSPEQAMAKRGVVDHRTDIYSLGATLYELLTLQPVFDGRDRHALLHQIGFEEPKPPRAIDATIPFELETIILKALAKNPTERYTTAQELADDLQRFLDDKPIQAKRPSIADRGRKWMRRHPSVVVATMVVLVLGLIGFAASTVVVSREKANTQAANKDLTAAFEKLAVEEKETKAAYKKVAIEEKRTKAAYDRLAQEQGRTKAAYEAEEFQRRLAEWDFAQAQRAIELVVQFSEGELAQRPEHQDIRRRLLSTVLDYYEDFLVQHADDPGLQAGRERVAQLVTELSSLRGSTLIAVIRDGNVQAELKVSEEQKKRINAYANTQTKQPGGKDKQPPRPMDSTATVEKVLGEILEPAQSGRFQQIVLQVQNQGRYGFSDPKLVDSLKLTTGQREQIRKIQAETHKTWADHVFRLDKKIKTPAEFWADVQDRILMVLDTSQRLQWREMAGNSISVEFREGYPFDGKNVNLPGRQPFEFHNTWRGDIAVMQAGKDHTGSGFGHKTFIDDKQYYAWRGKEIAPTAFEIAVTADTLSKEERFHLVTKGDKPPPETKGPKGWTVLFRSADPSVWNTDSPDAKNFAIPVERAPGNVRYLRLKRMDTGEFQIIAIRHADLTQAQKATPDQDFVWNGTANDQFKARHLGIAETRPLGGGFQKGKGAKKGPPGG